MLGVSVKSKARFELGADDVIENENLSTKLVTLSFQKKSWILLTLKIAYIFRGGRSHHHLWESEIPC